MTEPGAGAGNPIESGPVAIATRFHTDLPINSSASAQARRFVTSKLAATPYVDLTPTAALVVSELVTNALRGSNRRLEVEVRVGSRGVDVGVGDDAPGEPHIRRAGSWATGGRGLPLIDAVVKSRRIVHDVDGKMVWCRLECPDR